MNVHSLSLIRRSGGGIGRLTLRREVLTLLKPLKRV